MFEEDTISLGEKKLLTIIGNDASLSSRQILDLTGYKRHSTIHRKMRKFREMDMIHGPYYDINLSAIGNNQIYNIYADISFSSEDRDILYNSLLAIPGIRRIFLIQQGNEFFVHFQCNHYSLIGHLLSFLHKQGLIEYRMVASRNRWINVNPDFFGSPFPEARGLLNPCRFPDLSYSPIKSKLKWSKTDLIFLHYLRSRTDSTIEICRLEHREYGRLWKYNDVRNSIRKMKESGIIYSKDFHISPYPRSQCCNFILVLDSSRKKSLLKVLVNFGRGCRIYKSFTAVRNTGFLFCWASTEIMPEIYSIFDGVEDITINRLYYLTKFEDEYTPGRPFESKLFNTEKQNWEFPYSRVKKKIEDIIAGE